MGVSKKKKETKKWALTHVQVKWAEARMVSDHTCRNKP
jgi:hypothetical protein